MVRKETVEYFCDICTTEIQIGKSYDIKMTFGSVQDNGAFHMDYEYLCFDCWNTIQTSASDAVKELRNVEE